MKLIVGLGNPGKRYQANRHNFGFMAVERLAKELGLEFKSDKKFQAELAKNQTWILLKPQTFMNRSGLAVARARQFFKLQPKQIWVIHDDLDIALGKYKLQLGRGPKEHNGLSSIEQYLKTKVFWRFRGGVENRQQRIISGEDYVLEDFSKAEKPIVEQVINQLVKELINGTS